MLHCDIHVEARRRGPSLPWVTRSGCSLRRRTTEGSSTTSAAKRSTSSSGVHGDGTIEVADPLDRAVAPCYDAKGLTRMYDHLTTVSRYMNQLGWANYANDHEDANGQFEQNFRFADAVTSADRLISSATWSTRSPTRRHGGDVHAEALCEPDR